MLHIVFLRIGPEFPPAYAVALRNALRKHCSVPHILECFTDQPEEIEGVVRRPTTIQGGYYANKLALGQPGLFPEGDQVLFLETNCIIFDNIDWLATCLDRYRASFASLTCPKIGNPTCANVMTWRAGAIDGVYQDFRNVGLRSPWADKNFEVAAGSERLSLDGLFPTRAVHGLVKPDGSDWFAATNMQDPVKLWEWLHRPPHRASIVHPLGRLQPHQLRRSWFGDAWRELVNPRRF
jgi:hypothetical protein